MHVLDSTWKRSWRAAWKQGGMCFIIMPCTPSGPAALWFEVRRRASCRIAREIHPDIMEVVCSWGEGTRASHGNGAPDGSVGSGDSALIFTFCTCAMTSAG